MSGNLVFQSGQRSLSGHMFSSPGGKPGGAGILYIHGSGSDQSGYRRRAEAASANLGATCLTFDLSGHGQSGDAPEMFSPRDHLDDVVAAFDTLVHIGEVDAGRTGVCAASYGAYLAALLISSRPVKSLLLRAPALYPDQDLDSRDGIRLSSAETPNTSAALRGLAEYHAPVMILESERDELIPHAVVEAYMGACSHARHEVIPRAGHRLVGEELQSMFIDILVEWFRETLTA